ncbi:MAG: Trk system potassium transporter TrkA [Gemmatimonadota bacterium]
MSRMRVLIIGAGEVGFHLAHRLSEEEHDVVIIESDPDRAEYVGEHLDVMTVVGNGASLPILEKAGIKRTELLLAVTSRDEVNVMSCFAASRFEVPVKVARVSNPDYYHTRSALSRETLGIDLLINPERECAWETFQLLNSQAATDLARFANDKLQLIGLRVREGAVVAGKTLRQLDEELHDRHYVTVAIVRDGDTTIPRGDSRVEAGDQVFVIAPTPEIASLQGLAGYADYKLRRVMIAGGSDEGVYLARHLEAHGVESTLIELDRRRCVELAEMLPSTLVLNGDATDMDLLEMEGIEGIDGFAAFTGHDEVNMLSSLLAKTHGARKVISLINRFGYIKLVNRVGIDAAVSPRLSTINAILRYVRRGNVRSVVTIKGIDAEAMEFEVSEKARAKGEPLAALHFPEGAIAGAILRGDTVIMPRGRDVFLAGDRVVVFALPDAIGPLEKLFA